MNVNEYKKMYNKMKVSDEMDFQIRRAILNSNKIAKNKVKWKFHRGLVAVSSMALLLGVCAMNTSVVSAAIEKIVHYFSYSFFVSNESGENNQIEMKQQYFEFNQDAPMTSMKLDSVQEAGEKIGVDLLESSNGFFYDGCVTYNPVINESGDFIGAAIIDRIYCTGDLEKIKVNKASSADEVDMLEYKVGEKYVTPIMTQVSVRSDKDWDSVYSDNELGFVSEHSGVDLTQDTENGFDAEVYELENLNVKAVIYNIITDGPVSWGLSKPITVTNAVFVYEGIEYVYAGGVNHDTMKEFLNSLQ